VKYSLFALFGILLVSMGIIPVYGHTTVEVPPYEIEVGWGTEPPVVGFRNDFVFEISEPSEAEGVKTGVISAFKNLEATAKFGGIIKKLDINSDPRPGHYFSPVIPTKTGSISIEIKGEINGILIDVDIPVEDVESTAVLDFPPTSGSSSDQDIAAMKNAISSMQKDVTNLKSKVGGVDSSEDFAVGPAYNFAVFGLSLGAAGVILAIIAMIKRK
jgi:hypothetical protein